MHYVYGENGAKYGPADLPTLQQWVGEGRIAPATVLEDSLTGMQISAGSLPGLFNVQSQPAQTPAASPSQPIQTPYVRYDSSQDYSQARNYGQASLVLLVISCIPCCVIGSWWGIAISATGLGCAVAAQKHGYEKGQAYFTWGIIMVVINVIGFILATIFSGSLAGLGY